MVPRRELSPAILRPLHLDSPFFAVVVALSASLLCSPKLGMSTAGYTGSAQEDPVWQFGKSFLLEKPAEILVYVRLTTLASVTGSQSLG